MFTMLHSIFVLFVVQWLSKQEWAGPLMYWLLGYFTASVLATGIVLLFVWLSSRTRRGVKRPAAGSVTNNVCAASAAIGG